MYFFIIDRDICIQSNTHARTHCNDMRQRGGVVAGFKKTVVLIYFSLDVARAKRSDLYSSRPFVKKQNKTKTMFSKAWLYLNLKF